MEKKMIEWKGQLMELGEKEAIMVALQRVYTAKRILLSMKSDIHDDLSTFCDCDVKYRVLSMLYGDTKAILKRLNLAIEMLKELLPEDIADELIDFNSDNYDYIKVLD